MKLMQQELETSHVALTLKLMQQDLETAHVALLWNTHAVGTQPGNCVAEGTVNLPIITPLGN
jgi:hypothetical protein